MNVSDLEKNKAIINRFDEAFFRPDGEPLWMAMVSEDLTDHTAPGGPKRGKDAFLGFFKAINSALSNMKVEILNQIAEHDLVVTQKTITGDHTGNLFGVSATNKPFTIDAIEIIRIKDGKYVDHWVRANLWEKLATGTAIHHIA